MAEPTAPTQTLSRRGGALVLKSISLFLAGSRNAKKAVVADKKPLKQKRAKMNEKNIIKCPSKVIEAAKRDTHFSRADIEILYKIYKKLVSTNRTSITDKTSGAGNSSTMTLQEGVDRTVFCELMHNTFDLLTEDMIMDRIFCVWDKTNAGIITLESWFHWLSVFLKGTISEQVEFCFAVYDLNNDGFITKDEIFQLLKYRNCLIKHPQEDDPEESVKDLVELVLRKLDQDKDGKVSLEDYRYTVAKEPLLLEAFGKCLPPKCARVTFLSTMRA